MSSFDQALKLYDDFVRKWGGSKLNVTLDMFDTACLPTDPMLWVLGIGENIPAAIQSLTEGECVDAALNRLTGNWGPRGALPRRFRGCRGSHRFRGRRYFSGAGIPSKGPGWAAFRLASFIQRVGWWMLIANTTQDLFVDSIGSLMRYGGCADPPDRMATGSFASRVIGSGAPFVVDCLQQYSSYGPALGLGGFILPNVTEPQIHYMFNTEPFFGQYTPPSAVWLNIKRSDGFQTLKLGYEAETIDGRRQWTGHYYDKTAQSYTYTGQLEGIAGDIAARVSPSESLIQLQGNRTFSFIDALKNGDPCALVGGQG